MKNLQQDLDDHEVQHRFAVGAHVTQVNDLLRLHDQRQREQSDWFASDARTLADSFSDEAAEITQRHAKQKRDMLDVLDAMAKTHDLSSHHQRAAFETSREEIKSKNAEEFDVARAKLEKVRVWFFGGGKVSSFFSQPPYVAQSEPTPHVLASNR